MARIMHPNALFKHGHIRNIHGPFQSHIANSITPNYGIINMKHAHSGMMGMNHMYGAMMGMAYMHFGMMAAHSLSNMLAQRGNKHFNQLKQGAPESSRIKRRLNTSSFERRASTDDIRSHPLHVANQRSSAPDMQRRSPVLDVQHRTLSDAEKRAAIQRRYDSENEHIMNPVFGN